MEFEVGGVPPGRPPLKWGATSQTMNDLRNVRCMWRGRVVVVKAMYGGGEEPVRCWIHLDGWNTCMTALEELEPMMETETDTSTTSTAPLSSHLESLEWS